jgi:hypothetical protein
LQMKGNDAMLHWAHGDFKLEKCKHNVYSESYTRSEDTWS